MSTHHKISKTELFAAFIACTLLAVPFADAKPGQRGGKDRSAAQFERLDTDTDGVLILDELTTPALEKAENKFNRKDEDENGLLTFEEWVGDREPRDLSDIADEIVLCVTDLQVEDESIVVPDASRFDSAQDKFNTMDLDASGELDLSEVQTKVTEKVTTAFESMDTDNSNDVTEEEYSAYKDSAKATRRAIKSCIEELTSEAV